MDDRGSDHMIDNAGQNNSKLRFRSSDFPTFVFSDDRTNLATKTSHRENDRHPIMSFSFAASADAPLSA